MINRFWLFGFLLFAPVVGFLTALGIQSHINSKLHQELRSEYPDADAKLIANITISSLCENAEIKDAGMKDACSIDDNLSLLSLLSLTAGAIGLILFFGIFALGFLARGNRTILFLTFKYGLYITGLTLILLVVLHAGIITTSIYYGESVLVGKLHVFILIAIGIGAITGIVGIARNIFSVIQDVRITAIGTSLSVENAPLLWAYVEKTSTLLGSLKPDNIIVGIEPTFYVTESPVACLSGNYSGRTLYCSLPLMRIFSFQELRSVIGHELGHFKGNDTKFSQKFFPIYRGTSDSIAHLQAVGTGSGIFALLPAIAIFSYFLESFSVAENRISRERELAADLEGAKATDKRSIASALVKIHAFSSVWNVVQQTAVSLMRDGKVLINASTALSEAIRECSKPSALIGVAENHLSHPTDSHPSLKVRLESLNVSLVDIEEEALNVTPVTSAIELIALPENLEVEISQAYQEILADRMGINLNPDLQN